MNETDHPKYLALVGELGSVQALFLESALTSGRLSALHGDDYPTLSAAANAEMTDCAAVRNHDTIGTDLYIRLRDVEPLIKAAREVGPLESFTALDEALTKLEDIP